jgi:hypothetical protein
MLLDGANQKADEHRQENTCIYRSEEQALFGHGKGIGPVYKFHVAVAFEN